MGALIAVDDRVIMFVLLVSKWERENRGGKEERGERNRGRMGRERRDSIKMVVTNREVTRLLVSAYLLLPRPTAPPPSSPTSPRA
jgi:hypothetical protein